MPAEFRQLAHVLVMVDIDRRIEFGRPPVLLNGLIAAANLPKYDGEVVVSHCRLRPDRRGRLEVTECFAVFSMFAQESADLHVEQEIAGVILLESLEEREAIRDGIVWVVKVQKQFDR